MHAMEFKDDEAGYLGWLQDHPDGLVANTEANLGSPLFRVHRAACAHISTYSQSRPEGGFTERTYIKVCADGMESLLDWARRRRASSTVSRCAHCAPEPR